MIDPYLHSSLSKFCPLSQLLSGIDVRVVCSLKGLLQEVELFCSECCSTATLLSVECDPGLRIYIGITLLWWGNKELINQ